MKLLYIYALCKASRWMREELSGHYGDIVQVNKVLKRDAATCPGNEEKWKPKDEIQETGKPGDHVKENQKTTNFQVEEKEGPVLERAWKERLNEGQPPLNEGSLSGNKSLRNQI